MWYCVLSVSYKEKPNMENQIKTGRKPSHGHRHRGKRTPEYIAWDHMMQRCYNPNAANYKDYGGRGIRVCLRWHRFENFLADMGLRPDKGYSLDKVKNNKDYELENCRWATKEVQQNNRRDNVFLTFENETRTLTQWSVWLGIPRSTIYGRRNKGMTTEQILTVGVL